MPRCYMVKKALCNKYINSITKGFEDWPTRYRSPSPPPIPLLTAPSESAHHQQQPLQQQQIQQQSIKLPAPVPRYASSVSSAHNFSPARNESSSSLSPVIPSVNLQSSERAPVIVSVEAAKTTIASSQIEKESQIFMSGPKRLESINKSNSTSDSRPPRSFEQPQAKSAFSRPKQTKAQQNHSHTYDNDSSTAHPSVLIPRPCIPPSSTDVPLFSNRSAAETEAAHDLLELSRSLPPLPTPSVAIGPQNVIEHPASDVQEMTVYQPTTEQAASVYQVNTIDLTGTTTLYHPQLQHPHIHQTTAGPSTSIIYEPTTLLHADSIFRCFNMAAHHFFKKGSKSCNLQKKKAFIYVIFKDFKEYQRILLFSKKLVSTILEKQLYLLSIFSNLQLHGRI